MARRKKSFADIYNQVERIKENTSRQMTGLSPSKKRWTQLVSRMDRVHNIGERYKDNIVNEIQRTGVKANMKTQFSQRVYMGLVNG